LSSARGGTGPIPASRPSAPRPPGQGGRPAAQRRRPAPAPASRSGPTRVEPGGLLLPALSARPVRAGRTGGAGGSGKPGPNAAAGAVVLGGIDRCDAAHRHGTADRDRAVPPRATGRGGGLGGGWSG